MVKLTDSLNKTLVVDRDIKPQNKQRKVVIIKINSNGQL